MNEMEAILDGPAHSEIVMLLVETAFLPRHEPPQIRGKLGDAIYESMKQCMKKSRGSGFKWLAMQWSLAQQEALGPTSHWHNYVNEQVHSCSVPRLVTN